MPAISLYQHHVQRQNSIKVSQDELENSLREQRNLTKHIAYWTNKHQSPELDHHLPIFEGDTYLQSYYA